jgi:regulatory protein
VGAHQDGDRQTSRHPDPDADPESIARSICLRQLTMAPRSRAQLAETLRSKGVDGAVSTRVLDRLTAVGLVDDDAFADTFVRSARATRSLGTRALTHELRRRGVADDIVTEAVGTVTRDDELAAASALVARRLPTMTRLPREAASRRLIAMLARKGYPSGIAIRAVREALDLDSDQLGPID